MTIHPHFSPHMLWASIAFFILLHGFRLRKTNNRLHARLMTLGICMDLALVLLLEFQRNAIDTAVHFRLSPLQMCHVLSSSVAAVLYLPLLYLGFSMLKDPTSRPRLRGVHRKIGYAAFFFRAVGFIFMFSLMFKKVVEVTA